ncbi:YceO family protein [Citrobacter koseri]|nr:YceO family protein [Citrobacter koseri]HEI8489122.1 YceO family protein [Citrobacter koseri]HEM6875198.1 YceO family protein [Citrobacter koseri]HEM8586467.1 YceO family protein [Citrobacter koseri]
MRRIFHYLINNIREHFILYVILWSLLAIMDIIYIMFF